MLQSVRPFLQFIDAEDKIEKHGFQSKVIIDNTIYLFKN